MTYDAGTVEHEVEGFYLRYLDNFNEGRSDRCAAAFAMPYFDISNVDEVPAIRTVATDEDRMKYFAQHPYSKTDSRGKIEVVLKWLEVKILAPNIALLSTEVQRLWTDGSIAGKNPPDGKYRNYYITTKHADEWIFAGYVSDYPGRTKANSPG